MSKQKNEQLVDDNLGCALTIAIIILSLSMGLGGCYYMAKSIDLKEQELEYKHIGTDPAP